MKLKYKSGNTPLIKVKELSKRFGLNNLYIKDRDTLAFDMALSEPAIQLTLYSDLNKVAQSIGHKII